MSPVERQALIEERADANKQRYGLYSLKVAEDELIKEGKINLAIAKS